MAIEIKPVLIVGAGPTGMTAAMELSRFGIPVRLVDKQEKPPTTSRALAVQARTLELFQQRGLTEEMLKIGNRGTRVVIHGDGKRLGEVHLDQIESRYNFILLLAQSETERILREQLARQGIPIERGTEMIAFAQTEASTQEGVIGGVRAVLRDHSEDLEELEASYLISAEGAHSIARHTLALEFEGKSLPENYALADLHLDGDVPDDALSIFVSTDGFLAVFPMGNRHFRFIALDPQKHAEGSVAPTLDELQHLYDEIAHIPACLYEMTWSSRFRINSRMLHGLRQGRVFFGGDAAHVHSPAGGQGMNTGIQDMIDLSWKLALVWQGKADSGLLDTYEEDRLPVIRSVVAKTEAATDLLNSDNAVVHTLVTHIAPILLGKDFVQHLATGLISEVVSNYRASSLSQTSHAPGSLKAGDRLPDLPGLGDLYGQLNPSLFTLLVTPGKFEIPRESLTPWEGLLQIHKIEPPRDAPEANPQFEQCFGNKAGLFLVRPDSYLGFVGSGSDFSALLDWLNRWLPPAASPSE